ncbi:MAG: DUF6326 family protein [Solimonas sp.]
MSSKPVLDDISIHVRFKLAALWTSLMFCYVYGDYFGLYQPGKLQGMLDGRMGPLGAVTEAVLVKTSIMLAIPALMVFLSLVLPAVVCRWLNILLGLAYAVIMVLTMMSGAWNFYLMMGVIEIVLGLLTIWFAWTWPRKPASP